MTTKAFIDPSVGDESHPDGHCSARKSPIKRPPLPDTNTDVALIDLSDFAALIRMSKSWVLQEVAAGRAPQPVVRRPRCTRWKLCDVRAFAVAFAEQGAADLAGANATVAIARKASAAAKIAREKRTAKAASIAAALK